jgi:glucosamine--fructose-6-phosphate aminotransferase (isomerizing)
MTVLPVQMETEWREAPQAVRRQEIALAEPLAALVARLQQRPPSVVVTCARGSSAHAATFGKHLIERLLQIPVAAAAPNITTVYRQQLRLKDQLFLAISQSGRSDDLIEQASAARAVGAITACLINDTGSPLAKTCEIVLPMEAGTELAVAATKSFVAALAALARLTAAWAGDKALGDALRRLPDRLMAAGELDWSPALRNFSGAPSLVTIGRGPTLAIAREASLKFKETCNLHAEAFSGAEFLHGPVALVSTRYPLLLFMPTDAAKAGMQQLANDLRDKGAAVFTTEPGRPRPGRLPALEADHPDTDAICLAQTFYGLIVRLAALLGTDADRPRHLQKVTRTR